MIITYIFRRAQRNLLYLYNILLLIFGLIHASSVFVPKQKKKGPLCITQSLMNILSNMFIRQIAKLIIIFVYYQFTKPFKVKSSYVFKSFLYLTLTVISKKLVKFAILLIISMISSIVNVSIVIVQLLDNDTILYHLEIIIQFLDVLSIPVLILLFSFGKKKLKDCKDIICCIKEEEKTEPKDNKTNEIDSALIDESKFLQDSEQNSNDSSY